MGADGDDEALRRALFVAGDRSVTRSHAEALTDGYGQEAVDWSAARAHSALETKALIEHGGRPFDVIVIAPRLPDRDGLDLIADLRRMDATREVPLFLMTERGHDAHSRRIAAARYRLAGFIELPASPEQVRTALDGVRRRRRVLVVEPNEDLRERYRVALERAGFVPQACGPTDDPAERRRRFDPDLVAVALLSPHPGQRGRDVPDGARGLEICAELKRSKNPPKVLLYGPLKALEARSIDDNTQRADDFVKAPFDDELLAVRAAALVGLGAPELPATSPEETSDGFDAPSTQVDFPPRRSRRHARAAQRSASGIPRPSPRRTNRRVPCDITLVVETDGRAFRARTLDISPGGMFFALEPPFPVGTRLIMRFHLADTSTPIEAEGRVAWLGAGPEGASGMGVEFARIARDDLETIVAYVNRLSGVLYAAD